MTLPLPSSLPQRTQDNTKAEHLEDHNTLHIFANDPSDYFNIPPTSLTWNAASHTVTDIAVAEDELQIGSSDIRRLAMDLQFFNQSRLSVKLGVAANATAKLGMQFSTDESSWFWLSSGIASGMTPATDDFISIAATALTVGIWVPINALARLATVFLRLVTVDGDGAADPSFGFTSAAFRYSA